jgi:hypothetical protein
VCSEVAHSLASLYLPTNTCKRYITVVAYIGYTNIKPPCSSFLSVHSFVPFHSPDCVIQYPWQENKPEVKTALTTSKRDDMSRIRARNALKILLDVHGDFGIRAAKFSHPLLRQTSSKDSSSRST